MLLSTTPQNLSHASINNVDSKCPSSWLLNRNSNSLLYISEHQHWLRESSPLPPTKLCNLQCASQSTDNSKQPKRYDAAEYRACGCWYEIYSIVGKQRKTTDVNHIGADFAGDPPCLPVVACELYCSSKNGVNHRANKACCQTCNKHLLDYLHFHSECKDGDIVYSQCERCEASVSRVNIPRGISIHCCLAAANNTSLLRTPGEIRLPK